MEEPQKRRRFKQAHSLEERLAEDTASLREQIKLTPAGPGREQILRRIRQNETAARMSEWLSSPGLKPPN